MNAQDEVLLIKRNPAYQPHSPEFIGWEFCGGGIDHVDASPEEALQREYREELQIDIEIVQLLQARCGHRDGKPLLNLAYLCRYKNGERRLTDEHTQLQWVSRNQLPLYDLGPHVNQDRDAFLRMK